MKKKRTKTVATNLTDEQEQQMECLKDEDQDLLNKKKCKDYKDTTKRDTAKKYRVWGRECL